MANLVKRHGLFKFENITLKTFMKHKYWQCAIECVALNINNRRDFSLKNIHTKAMFAYKVFD
jgi:hypothetical protein